MTSPSSAAAKPAPKPAARLLESGIIFSAANFLANLLNFAFLAVIGRQLSHNGEFSLANNTLGFAAFLALPMSIATQAVTHYIARFHFSGDDARLHGLLTGCRRFLFWISVAGSFTALFLVEPLSRFFNFPRGSLMFGALAVVLTWLWGAYFTALCQGLAWFKRLALIALLSAFLRVLFGGITTKFWPVAEWAVLASVIAVSANLVLLFWKSDFPRRSGDVISPWNRDFLGFLVVAAACVGGGMFFQQGDMLVAQRYFNPTDRDAYIAAERLAAALLLVVGPLLSVLFTHRSGRRHHDALREQLRLVGLCAATLIFGAIALFLLRDFCLEILGRNTPEAASMIGRLSLTMVFVGLLQTLGAWSLASRWMKISLLYGLLGLAYWLALLFLGKSPADLLAVMPMAAGISFAIVFLVWLAAMRLHKIGPPEQS